MSIFLICQLIQLKILSTTNRQSSCKTNLIHIRATMLDLLDNITSEAFFCDNVVLWIECIHYRKDLQDSSRTCQQFSEEFSQKGIQIPCTDWCQKRSRTAYKSFCQETGKTTLFLRRSSFCVMKSPGPTFLMLGTNPKNSAGGHRHYWPALLHKPQPPTVGRREPRIPRDPSKGLALPAFDPSRVPKDFP